MTAIEEARAALAQWDRDDDVALDAILADALRALIAEHERLTAERDEYHDRAVNAEMTAREALTRASRLATLSTPTADTPTVMVAEPFTGSSGVSLVHVSPYADGVPSLMVDGVILPPNSVKALREFFQPAPPTDDEREALRRAVNVAISGPGGTRISDGALDRIIDAAAPPRQGPITDEWEYGVRHVDTYGWPSTTAHENREHAESEFSTCGMNCALVCRRKAGPWEPVEAARDAS